MNANHQPDTPQQRGTVVVMPPRRPQPTQPGAQTISSGGEQPAEEPGYGHGV